MCPRHKQDQKGGESCIAMALVPSPSVVPPRGGLRHSPNSYGLAAFAGVKAGYPDPAIKAFEPHTQISANATVRLPDRAVC